MNKIQNMAKSALETAHGELAAAQDLMVSKVSADIELQAELWRKAALDAVADVWRASRGPRWDGASIEGADRVGPPLQPSFADRNTPPAERKGPTAPSADLVQGMRAQIAQAKTSLLHYEMQTGKRLWECTRPDLRDAATGLRRQATTELSRARWFELIAGALKNDKERVGDALREADLVRFRDRAQRPEMQEV